MCHLGSRLYGSIYVSSVLPVPRRPARPPPTQAPLGCRPSPPRASLRAQERSCSTIVFSVSLSIQDFAAHVDGDASCAVAVAMAVATSVDVCALWPSDSSHELYLSSGRSSAGNVRYRRLPPTCLPLPTSRPRGDSEERRRFAGHPRVDGVLQLRISPFTSPYFCAKVAARPPRCPSAILRHLAGHDFQPSSSLRSGRSFMCREPGTSRPPMRLRSDLARHTFTFHTAKRFQLVDHVFSVSFS